MAVDGVQSTKSASTDQAQQKAEVKQKANEEAKESDAERTAEVKKGEDEGTSRPSIAVA